METHWSTPPVSIMQYALVLTCAHKCKPVYTTGLSLCTLVQVYWPTLWWRKLTNQCTGNQLDIPIERISHCRLHSVHSCYVWSSVVYCVLVCYRLQWQTDSKTVSQQLVVWPTVPASHPATLVSPPYPVSLQSIHPTNAIQTYSILGVEKVLLSLMLLWQPLRVRQLEGKRKGSWIWGRWGFMDQKGKPERWRWENNKKGGWKVLNTYKEKQGIWKEKWLGISDNYEEKNNGKEDGLDWDWDSWGISKTFEEKKGGK